MSDDREREDLEALLKAPGWLRFVNAQRKTWEEEFSKFVRQATNDTNDAAALTKLRQVIVARDAVLAALTYPDERLRGLTDMEHARVLSTNVPLSRRGSL